MSAKPRLVFKKSGGIGCSQAAVVVKTESLRSKFPGGLRYFNEECIACGNKDIAVICAMDDDELSFCIEKLLEHGLLPEEDFVRLDAFSELLIAERSKQGQGKKIYQPDMGVGWLKGSIDRNGLIIEYQEP